tara:strand:+ start:1537 stop:3273 length:1737 start_codon:yes stop_codon:yes gene_type:complete
MIHYSKNNNNKLFDTLKNDNFTSFTSIQNYIPIYKKFFNLNENNFNTINLNHKHKILEINKKNTYQIFNCIVQKKNKEKNNLFFKFSPLLDPVKYLTGKYKDTDISLLPKLNNNTCHEKLLDTNNCAYIDSFFSYLTSILLNEYNFVNGINFYGSFLGIKKEFKYNIYDDLEYLYDSEFFNENKDILFRVDNFDQDELFDKEISLKNRKKIKIDNSEIKLDIEEFDNSLFENIFNDIDNTKTLNNIDLSKNIVFKNLKTCNKTNHTSSTCSSRTSNTSEENSEEENSEEENSEEEHSEEELSENDDEEFSDEYSDSEISTSSEENLECNIFNFPSQIICLEKLENTLDSMLEDESYEISNKEWKSILMQVIMILLTYQKCFQFTHNDLHTNNIMYNKTDKKFICYRYKGKIYKIPTYGKIFKLIDFGRSIYKFKGVQLCSDSFHPKGDAATQFNFGPYYNDKKPKIEPNYSFDLTRLACSLYDFFIEEDDDIEDLDSIAKLIHSWILDDKGKNILYKKNGDERYPDFKLYKMITRLVHNHTPEKQLENPIFQKFITSKRKLNKKTKIIDIDAFEDFSN